MPSTPPRLRLGFCLAIVVLAGVAVSSAHADARAEPKNPEARAHFEMGAKLFNVKEFEKAIAEYKQGALIESLPIFDLALGQCYRMMHRYDDSLWHLERFIKYGHPTGKLLKGINEIMALMRAEIEKKAMTQEPTEVTPPPAPERSGRVSPERPPGQTTAIGPVPPTVEHTSPWYHDGVGLGLVGVGTIGVATAGYLLLDGRRLHEESNTAPSQASQDALNDQANSRFELGGAFGIGGLAALTVGVIRLATRPSSQRARAATAWNLSATSNGVVVFGTF